MFDSVRSRNSIDVLAPAWPRPVGGMRKRCLDVCLASIAIVVLSPVLLLSAVAVFCASRDQIIFRHRRVGFQREVFDCFKFQTMVRDSEQVLRDYLASHPAAYAEWNTTRKLHNDPRVTPLGRVLRRTSVDELPQLLNVIKGDMSLVGPRPIVEQELSRYGQRRDTYLACRPGITGVWQVNGRSHATYRKRVACDSYYGTHWSLLLDVQIMAQTLVMIMTSRGDAY